MRAVILGNQRLLVNLDEHLFVRDIFYKRVGQENHVLGTPHKIGVWADNKLSWLDEEGWEVDMRTDCALCSTAVAKNKERGITLTFQDVVLKDRDVLIRRISANRPVRVFIYHYFFLYGDGIGDCAAYDVRRNVLFHYKRRRYFMMTAQRGATSALIDYTISSPDRQTHKDAEDGVLSKNAIAQGNVDSCIAFDVHENETVDYLLIAGNSLKSTSALHDELLAADRTALVTATIEEQHNFASVPENIRKLKPEWKAVYETSLLVVRAHTDAGGAITAGNDSDNMLFNRDTYSYVWGRDGALVAYALDRAGKHELTRTFYNYMEEILEDGGYYLHKYHPDGSLGSSWHAWVRDGEKYLPIQEDSTALMLMALKNYHVTARDDFLSGKYSSWIAPMIDFMLRFVRDDMPLPKDCWDLWEERQGIHTWTVASVIAGLSAGAFFAKLHDDSKREAACKELAENMTHGMLEYLYTKQFSRFIRRLSPELKQDLTIDAADMAPFLFGVLPADHEAVKNTVKAIEENLMTPVGGIARYQGDYFHRKTEEAPGNAWIICTLWVAQWHITQKNWKRADELIDWVVKYATFANLLPEQVHAVTGEPLSVCPLTWSHATFIDTLLLYAEHKHG